MDTCIIHVSQGFYFAIRRVYLISIFYIFRLLFMLSLHMGSKILISCTCRLVHVCRLHNTHVGRFYMSDGPHPVFSTTSRSNCASNVPSKTPEEFSFFFQKRVPTFGMVEVGLDG